MKASVASSLFNTSRRVTTAALRHLARSSTDVTGVQQQTTMTGTSLGEHAQVITKTLFLLGGDRGFAFERNCVLRRWESETLK